MDIFNNAQKAWLLLEDGTLYEGYGLGCAEDTVGELVFNTSVVGYQEILTDPANANNIVVETFPLTGNYGVNREHDLHDSITAKGWVVREWCAQPSNFRCEGRIDEYLEQKKISAIFDLDTRAITRKLRDGGVQNALITRKDPTGNIAQLTEQLKNHQKPMPAWVDYKETFTFEKLDAKYNITMVNYGIRKDVIAALMARGCRVTVVPSCCTEKQVLDTRCSRSVRRRRSGGAAHQLRPAGKCNRRCTGNGCCPDEERRADAGHRPGTSADGTGNGGQRGEDALRSPRSKLPGHRTCQRQDLYHLPEPRLHRQGRSGVRCGQPPQFQRQDL